MRNNDEPKHPRTRRPDGTMALQSMQIRTNCEDAIKMITHYDLLIDALPVSNLLNKIINKYGKTEAK